MLGFLKGGRRYIIIAIGVALGLHVGFDMPIAPEEWEGFATATASFVTSLLALLSKFSPSEPTA
jgi:hypothetical protein